MRNVNDKAPSQCQNITEVRNEIDTIDRAILELLGQRFEYVKEVVKYKSNDADSIVAAGRRAEVLAQRRVWAQELGLNPDVVEEMYVRLVDYFIAEEKKILHTEE